MRRATCDFQLATWDMGHVSTDTISRPINTPMPPLTALDFLNLDSYWAKRLQRRSSRNRSLSSRFEIQQSHQTLQFPDLPSPFSNVHMRLPLPLFLPPPHRPHSSKTHLRKQIKPSNTLHLPPLSPLPLPTRSAQSSPPLGLTYEPPDIPRLSVHITAHVDNCLGGEIE